MNKIILASAAFLFVSWSANAEAAILKGQAAESFIAKYFPQASIPGPVSGAFSYIDKRGRHRKGMPIVPSPRWAGVPTARFPVVP
jgi:hypothetical protein